MAMMRLVVGLLLCFWASLALWRPDLWWVAPMTAVLFFLPWTIAEVANAWERSKMVMTWEEYFYR